jgi:hypothetical protein
VHHCTSNAVFSVSDISCGVVLENAVNRSNADSVFTTPSAFAISSLIVHTLSNNTKPFSISCDQIMLYHSVFNAGIVHFLLINKHRV